eukprot:1133422-Pelagomonas_calceolata.AAC.1
MHCCKGQSKTVQGGKAVVHVASGGAPDADLQPGRQTGQGVCQAEEYSHPSALKLKVERTFLITLLMNKLGLRREYHMLV